MNNGQIICYDSAGAERTIETPNLDSWLKNKGVMQRGKFKSYIFSKLQGSQNRSNWFMTCNYRDFTDHDLTKTYYMPICGVKEQPPVGRLIRYVEWLGFSEEDLVGEGFNNTIFGTGYVHGHESVYKDCSELLDILNRHKITCGHGIDSRQTDIVCRVMNAIWDTQIYDSCARIVILLEDSEADSMELLRQVYLLMPSQLRLQMGFMTNVSVSDIMQIGDRDGMAVYVMTANRSSWSTICEYNYSFHVYPLDVSNILAYNFREQKLLLLENLADMTSDPDRLKQFDAIEADVLKKHETTVPSFRYYEEMLKRMNLMA